MKICDDLRQAVLQAAIQGKLTTQRLEDGDARDLLKQIEVEKARLVKEKKIKKEKSLPDIIEDEKAFDIPENWTWTQIGTVCINIQYGTSSKSSKVGKVPVLRMGNIQNGKVVFDKLVYTSNENEISKYPLEKGDLLFNRTNSKELVGKVGIYEDDRRAIYAGYLVRITPLIDSKFLNYIFQTDYYRTYCHSVKTDAIGQSNINAEKLKMFMFPVPPLAEQQRIVAKVDKLMAEIDELEKVENELVALKNSFPNDMKSALLQAAMQGKLTTQRKEDGDAKDLLEQIASEKAKLIKEGKLKKEKPLAEITEDEKPFDIPEKWEWVRLKDITYLVGNKKNQISTKEILSTGKFFVVSQGKNLTDGFCNDITKVIFDLPLVMFGDHTRNVKYIDFPFVIGADGTKFHKTILVEAKYLCYWMLYATINIKDRGYARHYSLLCALLIPLPPLAEQERIVAKLDKLLPLCESLKEA